MAVIPFIPDGKPNNTIVQSKDHFDKNGDKVLILNADKEQLKKFGDGSVSNTSYDLRIGSIYWDVRKLNPSRLEKGKIKLKPKMFVEIETKEFVKFPITRAARISSKVSILRQGLGVFPTNVDPGYEGELVIYVCNFGNETIELKPDTKFCALKMETVEGSANSYHKSSKKVIGKEKEGYGRYLQWFKYNSTLISIIINILMLIATSSMAYFAYRLLL
jgi:deoxycytidine triphosphate deaminase